MADDGADANAEERPENPATACERQCVDKLTKANGLSRFETAKARQIWVEVGDILAPAVRKGWPMDTVVAMYTLLEANLLALSSRKTDEALEELHRLYDRAIQAAENHVDRLYVLHAKRAYAAVLVYYGKRDDAFTLLLEISTLLKREEAEDLWLQINLQLAEMRWRLGSPEAALRMLDDIRYPTGYIHMVQVATTILHAQVLWYGGKGEKRRVRRAQRHRGKQLARQAARDVHNVTNRCHPSSVWRAQLLRIPLVGFGLYRLAYNRMYAPLV